MNEVTNRNTFTHPIILGRINFGSVPVQTIVGPKGSASALPEFPSGYLQVELGSLPYLIPYYDIGTGTDSPTYGWLPLSGGTLTGDLSIKGLTTGSIVFIGAAGLLMQDNTQFFWDNTNFRLGVGIGAPTQTLDVNGIAHINGSVFLGDSSVYIANGNDSLGSALSVVGVFSGSKKRTAINLNIDDALWGDTASVTEVSLYGTGNGGVAPYHRLNVGWQSYRQGFYAIGEEECGAGQNAVPMNIGIGDHTNGVNREAFAVLAGAADWNTAIGSMLIGAFAQKTSETVTDYQALDMLVLHPPSLVSAGTMDSHAIVFSGNGYDTSNHLANWRLKTHVTSNGGRSQLEISNTIGGGNPGETVRLVVIDTGALGIGTPNPDTSALVDISSTTKGFLPPRTTSAQRDAISSPAEGLTIYNATDHALDVYNGTNWYSVMPSPSRVINGNMMIDQRNEGAAVTINSSTNIYGPDRWAGRASTTAVFTMQRLATSPAPGFANYLHIAVTTAKATLLGSDFNWLVHGFEASILEDMFLSTGIEQTTLSFWVRSNLTGPFAGGFVGGNPGSRNITFSFTVNAADTWEYKTITIVADSGASGMVTINNAKLITLNLSLGTGPNRELAPGAWSSPGGSGTRASVSGSNQLVSSLSNYLDIVGIDWRLGATTGIFQPEPSALTLMKCQRYYCKSFPQGTAPAQNAGVAGALSVTNPIAAGEPSMYAHFPVTMRAAPSVTTYNPSATNANWRDVTAAADVTVAVDPAVAKNDGGVLIATSATVTTLNDVLAIHYAANADF